MSAKPNEPSPELIAEYCDAPFAYEDEILALGERAVDPLIERLPSKYGYSAADMLGQLGLELPRVLKALRNGTQAGGGLAEASCRALGQLGEIEFLFGLVGDTATRAAAVTAILRGLKSEEVPSLDYRHAERLLDLDDSAVTEAVNETLAPGSQMCELVEADLPELMRGLESQYPVIRWHAVRALNNRLFKKSVKQVMPALAGMLDDNDATVRRMVLLSLAGWKSKAKPYHDVMRTLQNDPDPKVCDTAFYVFQDM
ncbi:MAG: HEAT repeat domain-containing protein [Planctomycetaceae bacterium]